MVKLSNNYFNNKCDYIPATSGEVSGGNSKKWNEFVESICQYVRQNFPKLDGKDMVKLVYDLINNYQLENPIKLDPNNASFKQVGLHAERWQRLSQSTIDHRLRCARRMARHPIFPIDFNELSYKQFIAYMEYRERKENASPYALMNDLRTMQMFLRAYHIDVDAWFYKLPRLPKHKRRIIPFPETVHKLINHRYSIAPYENALYQYLMFHNFFIGWRVPSEPSIMKVDDVNIDTKGRGTITITETKKSCSKRTIIPDKTILSAPTYKSFKNWIDHWRPKVENQYSGNYLYLRPSGKPFSVRYLGKELSVRGKQVWQPFQPYVSRHWCAISLLIRTKRESKVWETRRVQMFLGHDKQKTTDGYIEFAEEYYRQEPVDWFYHALRLHQKNDVGGQCEKTKRRDFKAPLTKIPPRNGYGLSGI
jgi:site-specific recombinase XerD